MSSENELIARSQAGDAEAFCLLARAYERRVYSLALYYSRGRQDAEDLSQEVWLKAFAALRTFRHESSFYTWLRKITINCFLNHQRSRSRSFWSSQQSDSETSQPVEIGDNGAPGLESTLQNRLVVEKVMQALSEVTPQQRLIFLLKHEEGMTYEEISRELGCSPGTVKKSVSRTVVKLRERLGLTEEPDNYPSGAVTGLLR
ncbi:MAG TPA: RNA polymerase sigma factor [Pyrinomonadaceae bacterium]|nr:RNA polymerase sigma factor [Pyrinomonadaceae bacterium]